jgi:hypothetical protein
MVASGGWAGNLPVSRCDRLPDEDESAVVGRAFPLG